MGGFDFGAPVTDVGEALVVGEDEDDVGRTILCVRRQCEQKGREQRNEINAHGGLSATARPLRTFGPRRLERHNHVEVDNAEVPVFVVDDCCLTVG